MSLNNSTPECCPVCKSKFIVKSGKQYSKKGVQQRYKCKMCGTTFNNSGYFKGKHPLRLVQYAITLYQHGYSLEKVQTELKNSLNVKISRTSILKWIRKASVPLRNKGCGLQKKKVVRDLVEIGVATTVRFASSFVPEKFLFLQNVTIPLGVESGGVGEKP